MAIAVLACVGVASSASALILTGGPTYTLPGGGSCSVANVTSRSGGATISCTGVNLSAHTKVYFGIKNDTSPNGNTMTGAAPTAGSSDVFRFLTSTPSSITYTSTTSITDFFHGTHSVDNRLVLTLTGGTASVLPTGGNPINNTNGDIQAVFQITAGTSFTIRADVQASDTTFALGNACPAVYDPSHANFGNSGDVSRVDVAFYYSDCGDGQVDSPEACDEGGDNGSSTSCCTSTCTFRGSGEVCRPGGGAPCDLSETCTGSFADCPPDDAIINGANMMVCRTGSGDVCDQNEVCNGVPGVACPPDDAPGNTMVTCRLSTTGDICDVSEMCTGVPGATCPPDDAPGKLNFLCRAGSGDLCDPDERCTGLPGQGCPQDIVANPSTVCRAGSGDMCDPSETCTAVPGQPCPANVITPNGTQCRASAGACDVAEACTGVAGQTCPANGFQPAATPCNVDNNVCTVDACNGSGACVFGSNLNCNDNNTCTQDSCDPINGCQISGAPSNSCLNASKAILKIKEADDGARDNARFLWSGGPSLIEDQGDPTQSTRYELCIYDNTGVKMAMGVDPGSGWEPIGSPTAPRGFKYKDLAAAQDGVKLIKTKASSLDKAKLKLIAKGQAMPDDPMLLPFQYPVTAQLYASDGACWEAQFDLTNTKKNVDTGFSAKTP